jgi:hypothetical protein
MKYESYIIEPAPIYQNLVIFLFYPFPLSVRVVMSYISRELPADRRYSNGALFGVDVRGGRLLDRIFAVLGNVSREVDTLSATIQGQACTLAKQVPCVSKQFFFSRDHRIADSLSS